VKQLEEVRRAARQRRWRVTGTSLTLGIVCNVLMFYFNTMPLCRRQIGFVLEAFGMFFIVLALLPTDQVAIRVVLLFNMVRFTIQDVGHVQVMRRLDLDADQSWETRGLLIFFCLMLVCHILYAIVNLRILFLSRRNALDALWMSTGIFLLAKACVLSLRIAFVPCSLLALNMSAKILVGLIFVYPRAREQVQALLTWHGDAVNVAGLIAGFIGGDADATSVHKDGARFFRYIYLEDVTRDDMMAATAGTRSQALFKRSRPALMGEVDAFVSHSWHDDGHAKWDALTAWCEHFQALHGRQAKLWLDFCCIDQDNIEQSLRCLPLYLSGCRDLLVIAGSTYVQRLWCLVELFVFLSIHGATAGKRLAVRHIKSSEEDPASVGETLLKFDATQCKCTDARDKQRLLDGIEAGSGTLDRFNVQVRRMLGGVQN
jgi:hypothetical protein